MSAVSVKIFQAIVAGAAAQGVAPPDLLEAAGVDAAILADPDARLPRAAENRMWHEAARLTRDEAFGLHLPERLPTDGLGAIGFALRSSPTIGGAYDRVGRYMRLVAHGPLLHVVLDDTVARLQHTPPAGDPAPTRHAVEFLLASLVDLARRGVDASFTPRAARFRHPPPMHGGEHHRVFGPDVRFEVDRDEVVIDRAFLDRPQREAEPALCEVLDRHLAAVLAALPPEGSFLERARAALASELADGDPTLESLADRLRMSPRSLQRRLQQEGCSLSALLDRLRADLAVQHLRESRQSIAEVAFLLGFSEVSTFHRAFKRWTGLTPAAYRRDPGATGQSP